MTYTRFHCKKQKRHHLSVEGQYCCLEAVESFSRRWQVGFSLRRRPVYLWATYCRTLNRFRIVFTCFTDTVVRWWYCECYAVLSAMSVAHSALLTYNAALHRPAYQSSVLVTRYGNMTASLANDGSRETNATKDDKPRCSMSQQETNPWWAVDLGRPTTIYRVDLTNIGGYGRRPGCTYLTFILFGVSQGLVIFSSIRSVYGRGVRYHSFMLPCLTLMMLKMMRSM